MKVKKVLKNKNGFSMVELLIALLIMAVIAAVAITLFGGVLGSSKISADRLTAENIKNQILTYMNQTNDFDLSCLFTSDEAVGTRTGDMLVDRLQGTITIPDLTLSTSSTASSVAEPVFWPSSAITKSITSGVVNAGDIAGIYPPFLDPSKLPIRPQEATNVHWKITIDTATQSVTVGACNDTTAASMLIS